MGEPFRYPRRLSKSERERADRWRYCSTCGRDQWHAAGFYPPAMRMIAERCPECRRNPPGRQWHGGPIPRGCVLVVARLEDLPRLEAEAARATLPRFDGATGAEVSPEPGPLSGPRAASEGTS